MKTSFLPAVLISLLIFLVHGCKPPVPPGIETSAASNITTTSMSSGGTVTSDGGAPVTSRGICWSTSGSPSIDLSTKTNDGSGLGSFTSSLNGLSPNTTYYIRAYATNEAGTSYGTQVSATTLAANALLTTTQATAITSYGAVTGGNITNDGGANITSRGVCWSTSVNPTADMATRTQDGSGSGVFTSTLTGLASRTTYYIRAYAVNAAGTAYGQQVTLETPASFSLSETSLTIASEGGSCNEVTVTAYLAWTAQITGSGNWLTLNTVSGNEGTSQLSFDLQPNTTSEDRAQTLTITCQDMTLDLTVTQLRAGGYIDDGDLF
ncbi:MAG TPA: BACON domain-containing carbohydrate-binding protein [Bacteroidales bacterium]|nr:BACON domain-containing carbohydrate-binding protein [Bacteroidales bacterium]